MSRHLSIVIPAYNEAEPLPRLLKRLGEVLASEGLRLETLVVDDGSASDLSESLRLTVSARTAALLNLKVVVLSRNFGKEAAVIAGLAQAHGDAVVIMDADLQHPPETIPEMVRAWNQGADVVAAVPLWSGPRHSESLFYRLYNCLADERIPADEGDFRLLSAKVVRALLLFPERDRVNKVLYGRLGFKKTQIAYQVGVRPGPTASMSVRRKVELALSALIGNSVVPLRLVAGIGLLVGVIGIAYALFIIAKTLIMGVDVPGYASTLSAVMILGGLQLISLGVMGEYLGKIFVEVKQRPLYLVSHVADLGEVLIEEGRQDSTVPSTELCRPESV